VAIYLRAAEGAYAERVLVAGDPGRITRLGESLEKSERITDNRGLVGFTGQYRGVDVSVQSSGMGCPSMAMVGEELIGYGVKRIVRIGTCSSFAEGVANGDLIVVTGSAAGDGTTASMAAGSPYAAIPDFSLTASLVKAVAGTGMRYHIGPVVTVDVEPHISAASTMKWREQGLLAVEMESSALFHLALRASQRRKSPIQAACVLAVSDGLDARPDGPQSYLSDSELEAVTDKMHAAALEALTS
jgi:DeoD family purine-nucleoside phosphorylase